MVHDVSTGEGPPGDQQGLTPTEDYELRQLTWFSAVGDLSDKAVGRLWQLIGRDRRTAVRNPRPNPSSPTDEEASTLPPPEMDRTASMTCPNCGALLSTQDRADT